MYLLYVDESGAVQDPAQHHFVLAGVAVFETKAHWLEQDLNQIVQRFSSDYDALELHGSPMRSGKDGWKEYKLEERKQAIKDALNIAIAKNYRKSNPQVRLFAAVINKYKLSGTDPVIHAFEQLSSRFDLFLKRLYKHNKGDKQRGLMLFDKSTTEKRIQTLAREFKYNGHSWGHTHNYAEVPVFLDSKASRLIQLADLVAFALYRHYQHKDSQYFNIIKDCFDSEGGVIHGLYENLL